MKNKAPNLSEIPWQVYDLNLYNYKYFNSIYLPRRIFRFLKRQVKEHILFQSPVIQRNWELQFLGKKNEDKLRYWLFETKNLNNIVSKRYSGKSFKDSSVKKKPKLSFKEKRKLKKDKQKKTN